MAALLTWIGKWIKGGEQAGEKRGTPRLRSWIGSLFGKKAQLPEARALPLGPVLGEEDWIPTISEETIPFVSEETIPFISEAEADTDEQLAAVAGNWVYVASSNVEKIRYLFADKTLGVGFLNGAEYEYYDVPVQIFLDFWRTDSPGRFVWNRLRDRYDYARVTPGSRRTKSGRKGQVIRGLTPVEIANLRPSEKSGYEEGGYIPARKGLLRPNWASRKVAPRR